MKGHAPCHLSLSPCPFFLTGLDSHGYTNLSRMSKPKWALVPALVLFVSAACANSGQAPQVASSPAASPVAPSSITPSPTAPGSPGAAKDSTSGSTGGQVATPENQAGALLARAVERLGQAKSFRFTVQAVHHWQTPDGKEYDWSFDGEGAAVPPNRFYSVMRGPADVLFQMKMIEGKITNVDARGSHPSPSTAFGGPGEGAAPYTVISYLKNSTAQDQPQAATLNGADTTRLAFTPNLQAVAGMDVSHKDIQQKVQAVQGSVWVDNKTGRVAQEAITVRSKDNTGLPQTVTITIKFTEFDTPVEIN